jgi:hypothetical protein
MQYVKKTIHKSDLLNTRESCKNSLRPKNGDNPSAYRFNLVSDDFSASREFLVDTSPIPYQKRRLREFSEASTAKNYQLLILSRKVFNLLIPSSMLEKYFLKLSSGKLHPGENLPSEKKTIDLGHSFSYLFRLTMKYSRPFTPRSALITKESCTKVKFLPTWNNLYKYHYQALIRCLKFDIEPKKLFLLIRKLIPKM